ncbi:hypothetical protein [Metabacillus sediminilitoris]|uniref:Uncharacterized protein n=1 Tax=Metabacillus sediminilitoris TaxID=2567941 RepID=A0A4V3WDV7_9BACI|nr:hypothetical protein [Metabacillus sediminilitoris]QGQ45804.1 hypothetical protein GMB29_11515 [Metabacillus sediminilitoris]THF73816.1 hypothetical protein E6W99_26085 [Metabacillus sediminilitoris]
MQVLVQVHYFYFDSKILKRGYFKVNPKKYKEDPDNSVAEVAGKWIEQMLMELPGMEIYKVLYDDVDITNLINVESAI